MFTPENIKDCSVDSLQTAPLKSQTSARHDPCYLLLHWIRPINNSCEPRFAVMGLDEMEKGGLGGGGEGAGM